MNEPTRIVWNCPECSNVLHIRPHTNYFSCHLCGAAYRLHWRSGQITGYISLKNIKNVFDEGSTREEVKENLTSGREELQALNSTIRRIEMSKSGERFKVLSLFVLLCAAIYGLFRFMVDGVRSLQVLTDLDLGIAAAASFAFLIFVVNGIYKNAMVRKVNRLIDKRRELEKSVITNEASLHMYDSGQLGGLEIGHGSQPQSQTAPQDQVPEGDSGDGGDDQQDGHNQDEELGMTTAEETEAETETEAEEEGPEANDIIKSFADKKKRRRKRLSIREDDE